MCTWIMKIQEEERVVNNNNTSSHSSMNNQQIPTATTNQVQYPEQFEKQTELIEQPQQKTKNSSMNQGLKYKQPTDLPTDSNSQARSKQAKGLNSSSKLKNSEEDQWNNIHFFSMFSNSLKTV